MVRFYAVRMFLSFSRPIYISHKSSSLVCYTVIWEYGYAISIIYTHIYLLCRFLQEQEIYQFRNLPKVTISFCKISTIIPTSLSAETTKWTWKLLQSPQDWYHPAYAPSTSTCVIFRPYLWISRELLMIYEIWWHGCLVHLLGLRKFTRIQYCILEGISAGSRPVYCENGNRTRTVYCAMYLQDTNLYIIIGFRTGTVYCDVYLQDSGRSCANDNTGFCKFRFYIYNR